MQRKPSDLKIYPWGSRLLSFDSKPPDRVVLRHLKKRQSRVSVKDNSPEEKKRLVAAIYKLRSLRPRPVVDPSDPPQEIMMQQEEWSSQRPLIEWKPQLEQLGVQYLHYLWALAAWRKRWEFEINKHWRRFYGAHPELHLLRDTHPEKFDIKQIHKDALEQTPGTRGCKLSKLIDAMSTATYADYGMGQLNESRQRFASDCVCDFLALLDEKRIDGFWFELPGLVSHHKWKKLYGNTRAMEGYLNDKVGQKNIDILRKRMCEVDVEELYEEDEPTPEVIDRYEKSHTRLKILAEQASCAHPECGARGSEVKLSYCTRCRAVFYCSKNCQRRHWATHRGVCSKAKPVPKE